MTCIVGLEQDGKAYMGADSFVGGFTSANNGQFKVVKKGKFLLGISGKVSITNVIQNELEPLTYLYDTDEQCIYFNFIKPLKKLLKEEQSTEVLNNVNTFDTSALLIYNNKLYEIDSGFAYIRSPKYGSAIGYGYGPATGSLFTTYKLYNKDPIEKLTLALQAALETSEYVREPFIFYESEQL